MSTSNVLTSFQKFLIIVFISIFIIILCNIYYRNYLLTFTILEYN